MMRHRSIQNADLNAVFGNAPRLLMVASTGGHLEQLKRVYESSCISRDSVFVATSTEQSKSLIGDSSVHYVSEVGPRDFLAAARVVPDLVRILRSGTFDGVLTTGAAVAGPAAFAGRLFGVPTLYIESVSRVHGPSLSGRLVASSHLASSCWTQHRGWEGGRWEYHGSLLGEYRSSLKDADVSDRTLKVFVTLGTWRHHSFNRLVDSLSRVIPHNWEIVWQLGSTHASDLRGSVYDYMSVDEFDAQACAADVVVSHAGVGSVLRLFDLGVYPLLVPRRLSYNEHVDDHQQEACDAVSREGLALAREASTIRLSDLRHCATRYVSAIETDSA